MSDQQHHFEMHITKATIDENGRMKWAATASDTSLDVFGEAMSLELYHDFVGKFPNKNPKPFVSLSHYPKLDGKGDAGVVEKLYIDNNMLKASGYFYDNPLGKAIYDAIREDRKNNVPYDKRVRVSIGFYDQKHAHGEAIWKIEDNRFCDKCAVGEKNKVYLAGDLDHLAVTRIPANKRTEIIVRSEGEENNMTTRAEDAKSIVPEELVEEIEKAAIGAPVHKSDNGSIVERSDVAEGETVDDGMWVRLVSPKVKALLVKMLEDGTLTEDGLISTLNKMLNGITSQSEAKVGKTDNVTTTADVVEKAAPKGEYGSSSDAGYADPGYQKDKQPRYPLKEGGELNETRIRAAWNYINQEKNAAEYSPEDVKKIKAKIIAAWKQKIDKEGPPSAAKSEADSEISIKAEVSTDDEKKELVEEACKGGKKKKMDMGEDGMDMGECEDPEDMQEDEKETADLGAALANAVKPMVDAINALAAKIDALPRTASVAEVETKAEEVVETPTWKAVIQETENLLGEAVQKTGNDRQMAFQGVIDLLGQKLLTLHGEMLVAEQPPVAQSAVKENVAEIVQKAVAEKTGELSAKIDALTRIIENSVVAKQVQGATVRTAQYNNLQVKPVVTSSAAVEVPQAKGFMGQQPQQVQRSNNKGMSIADIARLTTQPR